MMEVFPTKFFIKSVFIDPSQAQEVCILFCAGKTRIIWNWSDLFVKSHATVVSVPGEGCYTLLKFLRHLLFTQLQISRVLVERMVSIVSKHERIPEWMSFSEKVDQALVVTFTFD